MKFGVSVSTFATSFGPIMYSGNLNHKLDIIAAQGYTGVDLFIKNSDEPGIDKVVDKIKKIGLKVVILAAVSAFVDDGLYLSSPQKEIRAELIHRMKGQIELAAELGAYVPIGVIRGSEGGEDRKEFLAESLYELFNHAEKFKVKFLLEPVNRYETQLINTVDEALSFMDEFRLPEMQLLVDIFHMNIEEQNIEQVLLNAGHRIGHIHIADNTRRVPGMGHIDWEKILKNLNAIEYSGYCSIEAIPGKSPESDTEFSYKFLQEKLKQITSNNQGRKL